jgi:hypothetical protein
MRAHVSMAGSKVLPVTTSLGTFMIEQLHLNFDAAAGPTSGLDLWREQHRAQLESLARHSGLPLGQAVRVWLASGVLLEDRLLLAKDELFIDHRRFAELRLRIDHVDFQAREIESCVRTD